MRNDAHSAVLCGLWCVCWSGCAPSLPPAVPTTVPAYECDCAVLVDGEMVPRPHCLHRDGGVYRMDPEALAVFAVPTDTTTFEASSSCGTFHVRSDGRAMPTQPFDNGADYFCSGLTRYVLDGKYGYMNRALEVVVPPSYDFAFPFDGEHGGVCNDCTLDRSGEHTAVSCTRCGAVDKSGALVIALELSSQELFVRFPSGECE